MLQSEASSKEMLSIYSFSLFSKCSVDFRLSENVWNSALITKFFEYDVNLYTLYFLWQVPLIMTYLFSLFIHIFDYYSASIHVHKILCKIDHPDESCFDVTFCFMCAFQFPQPALKYYVFFTINYNGTFHSIDQQTFFSVT